LKSCLVANSQTNLNSYGTLIDLGNNLSSDASCRFTAPSSRNATDPQLLSLADNGGFTPTMAVAFASPANKTDGTKLPVDQRGVPRKMGNIGAFESSLTVGGWVTEGVAGLKNITLTLTGAGLTNVTTVTASNGFYSFNFLVPGTYTVRPPLNGRGFTPTNQTVLLVSLNSATANFAATPPSFTGVIWSNVQTLALNAVGVPNQPYAIQSSTNLSSWQPFRTNTADYYGALVYSVPYSTNIPIRFFRFAPR
jgi:hypothetical protein